MDGAGGCEELLHRTRVVDNSLDPSWGESFVLPDAGDAAPGPKIAFSVLDHDDGDANDLLGRVTVPDIKQLLPAPGAGLAAAFHALPLWRTERGARCRRGVLLLAVSRETPQPSSAGEDASLDLDVVAGLCVSIRLLLRIHTSAAADPYVCCCVSIRLLLPLLPPPAHSTLLS